VLSLDDGDHLTADEDHGRPANKAVISLVSRQRCASASLAEWTTIG
jgi:hypothetical protein